MLHPAVVVALQGPLFPNAALLVAVENGRYDEPSGTVLEVLGGELAKNVLNLFLC